MIKHDSPISGIATYKNRYIATAGYDNKVILWSSQTKQSIGVGFHDHLVNHCDFSPDGKLLVSASSDYSARIWHVPSMSLKTVLLGHTDDVEKAVFNKSGTLIATGSSSFDVSVRVFNLDGRELHRFCGHTKTIVSLLWSKSDTIITCSEDGSIREWSLVTGKQINVFDFGNIQLDAIAIGFNAYFSGDDDGIISIIRKNGNCVMQAHNAGIKSFVVNLDGNLLASTSYDQTIKVWEIDANDNLKLISTTTVPEIIWLRSCSFLGPDKLVLSTFGTSYATLHFHTGKWDMELVGKTKGINHVNVINNNIYTVGDAGIVNKNYKKICDVGSLCNFVVGFKEYIVTGGHLGQLFDVRTGKVLYKHRSPLNCATVVSDGNGELLLIGTYTGECLVFRNDEHEQLEYINTVQMASNAIKGICSNGQNIAIVGATGVIAIFSNNDFKLINIVEDGHDGISNGIVSLSDGRFATVSRDRYLRLWSSDAITVEKIKTPHDHSIKDISSWENSHTIVTGSYNGLVGMYCWKSGTWKTMRPTNSGISAITLGKVKNQYLASSYNGEIYII